MTDISTVATRGRRGLVLVIAGLTIQIGAALSWSPGTFVLSAAVGLPLVVIGAGLFGWGVWRANRVDEAAEGGARGARGDQKEGRP